LVFLAELCKKNYECYAKEYKNYELQNYAGTANPTPIESNGKSIIHQAMTLKYASINVNAIDQYILKSN